MEATTRDRPDEHGMPPVYRFANPGTVGPQTPAEYTCGTTSLPSHEEPYVLLTDIRTPGRRGFPTSG